MGITHQFVSPKADQSDATLVRPSNWNADHVIPAGYVLPTSTEESNWNTAYGWGNHASAGYLTAESDPVFCASAAHGIASGDISNWNSAYNLRHAQSHVLNGGDHTVSGLTPGHFLKALTADTFGFAAHGLSYGDVGAAPLSHAHAWGDITSGVPTTWTPIAHDLLSAYHGDTTGGSVVRGDIITGQGASPNTKWARLVKGTSGYFFKAGADDVGWAAHGLTYSDVGAAASSHTQAVSTISDSTTVGQNLVKLTDPSAITFLRINANNSVDALGASDFRTAIGAGSSSFDGSWGSLSGKPTIVVTFGNLSNSAGWLHNDGSGVLAWSTPSYSDVGADQAGAAAARQAAFTILTTLGNLSTVTTGWLHNTGGTLAYSTPTYSDVGADVAGAAAARQAAFTILTTLGNLSNSSGWLHNDGAGALAYSTPTYSDVGALASGGTAANSSQLEGHAAAYFQIAGSYQASSAILSALAGLTYVSGTPLLRMTGASAFSLDTATYLTSVTAHNLLSTTHGDTTASSCARGSVIIGDSNSKWVNLAFPATPTGKVLQATATDVAWSTSALGSAAYTATSAYEASGAIATHAALITGVHGLTFTAGKALTLTESLTLNALPIGGLAVATGANTLGSLAVGLTTQILVGGGAGTVPAWGTDIPTAVTIGSAYVYRAAGTDVAVADGGTNKSSWTQYCIPYASTTTALSEIAIGAAGKVLAVAAGATGYEWTSALTNPMTNIGDLIYGGAAGAPTRLADVAVGSYLASGGVNTIPLWATLNQAAVAGLTTADGPSFAHLHLADLAAIYTAAESWIGPSSTTGVYFKGGNVGIGTTAPNGKLDVVTIDGAVGSRVRGTSGTVRLYPYYDATYGSTLEALTPAESGYVPFTFSGSKFIFNGGNVGIGTTTPRRRGDFLDTAGPQFRLTYTDNSVFVDQLANSSGQWVVTPSAGALTGLLKATAGVMSTLNTSYVLVFTHPTSEPTTGTWYMGNQGTATIVGGINRVYIPRSGTITAAYILLYAKGTAGSNENIVLYVRKNNTTDTAIATVGTTGPDRAFINSALSIAVTAGDYIEIKMVFPSWATPPTTVTFGGVVLVE